MITELEEKIIASCQHAFITFCFYLIFQINDQIKYTYRYVVQDST